ncbi:MAG TPA: hypothetical protein VJU87_00435 [Gemmatimonadaceae bacterium]|nr:hypothetical protein [Gemmatimonadaceae bacterium]
MAKRKRTGRIAKHQVSKSPYFMQPGKGGMVVVLHRACGNRVVPKICGTMPSRTHAKMLINQLEKAESVVKDLFLEATDDGIEALEAVLAACREEVLRRGTRVSAGGGGGGSASGGGRAGGRRGQQGRGAPRQADGEPKFSPPADVQPFEGDGQEHREERDDLDEPPYNEAVS